MPIIAFAAGLLLRATSELKDSGRKGTFARRLGDARWLIFADIYLRWRWDGSLIKINVVAQVCHRVPFPYVSQDFLYYGEY